MSVRKQLEEALKDEPEVINGCWYVADEFKLQASAMLSLWRWRTPQTIPGSSGSAVAVAVAIRMAAWERRVAVALRWQRKEPY